MQRSINQTHQHDHCICQYTCFVVTSFVLWIHVICLPTASKITSLPIGRIMLHSFHCLVVWYSAASRFASIQWKSHYKVTSSLIGWVQTWNQPCNNFNNFRFLSSWPQWSSLFVPFSRFAIGKWSHFVWLRCNGGFPLLLLLDQNTCIW